MDKDDLRIEACGSIDEAVAALGLARSQGLRAEGLNGTVLKLQRELFVVGAEVATAPINAAKLKPNVTKVTPEMVSSLESLIDSFVAVSPLPNYFVVPGETTSSAALDVARSVVRRAERACMRLNRHVALTDSQVLRYLNRLSDLLFAAARMEETARNKAAPASR